MSGHRWPPDQLCGAMHRGTWHSRQMGQTCQGTWATPQLGLETQWRQPWAPVCLSGSVCDGIGICWTAGWTWVTAKGFSGLLGCINKKMTYQPRGWGACSTLQWGHSQLEDLVLFQVYVVYLVTFLSLNVHFKCFSLHIFPWRFPCPLFTYCWSEFLSLLTYFMAL